MHSFMRTQHLYSPPQTIHIYTSALRLSVQSGDGKQFQVLVKEVDGIPSQKGNRLTARSFQKEQGKSSNPQPLVNEMHTHLNSIN